MAAVVASTIPIWTASFSALDGRRPSGREAAGLALGLAGVVVLNLGGEITAHGPWAMVVLLGPAGFALGSVWSRRLPLPEGAMAAAPEMLCAGALLLMVGLVRGERLSGLPDGSALLAVGYLVVFGSLVGLTAYNFLLRETAPVVATSYAYVNPLVAVGLGVLAGGEMVGPATWVAGAVIVVGVGLITTSGRRGRAPETVGGRVIADSRTG